jgi:hypothetical protein
MLGTVDVIVANSVATRMIHFIVRASRASKQCLAIDVIEDFWLATFAISQGPKNLPAWASILASNRSSGRFP